MVHWKTLLALCAVLMPVQGASLLWMIRNEQRLTRIETILEMRFPLRPEHSACIEVFPVQKGVVPWKC